MWPRIVAEALRPIDAHPLLAGRAVVRASLEQVVAAIAAARSPDRSPILPPSFLLPHQVDPWRRAVAALDARNGALLVEPVGSGKTWIALAVAAREEGPVLAIVPAILREQWALAAGRARVPLQLWTHERASRSRLPAVKPTLVIVDEAHRLRDPRTRRIQTLAPWLVGLRTLLLTATPVVNRVDDLVTVLRLILPDDALALDGTALAAVGKCGSAPAGLARVVIRSIAPRRDAIARRVITVTPEETEVERGAAAVAAIDQLALSSATETRRLVRSVLLDAAASSDAAFHQALRRYRALLLHSRDAGGASRSMLRRFAGESLEQIVCWPLLAIPPSPTDLPLADLDRLEQLLKEPEVDGDWIQSLMALCGDQIPTVWFTRHRATASRLRSSIGEDAAWVTGAAAGIGPHRISRAAVLAAFGPARPMWGFRRSPPNILVATDVAAEGLDLQAAGRILHVDLPWTATRLDQREGRLRRLGQRHPQVEVILRAPAPAIEAALAPRARVRRKRELADKWLAALETDGAAVPEALPGSFIALLRDDSDPADLVAVRLRRDGCVGAMLMTRETDGVWCANDSAVARILHRARAASPSTMAVASVSTALIEGVHAAVARCTPDGCTSPALVRRIHRMARAAAARHDAWALERLDRLLDFVITATPLGGRIIAAQLLELPDHAFLRHDVPVVRRRGPIEATMIGAVILRRTCGT